MKGRDPQELLRTMRRLCPPGEDTDAPMTIISRDDTGFLGRMEVTPRRRGASRRNSASHGLCKKAENIFVTARKWSAGNAGAEEVRKRWTRQRI
jgi:hypothetical protein